MISSALNRSTSTAGRSVMRDTEWATYAVCRLVERMALLLALGIKL